MPGSNDPQVNAGDEFELLGQSRGLSRDTSVRSVTKGSVLEGDRWVGARGALHWSLCGFPGPRRSRLASLQLAIGSGLTLSKRLFILCFRLLDVVDMRDMVLGLRG